MIVSEYGSQARINTAQLIDFFAELVELLRRTEEFDFKLSISSLLKEVSQLADSIQVLLICHIFLELNSFLS